MELNAEVRRAIESAIRERFGDSVEDVRIVEDSSDEAELRIEIVLKESREAVERSDRFFGLTRHVLEAMRDGLKEVFPVLRPVVAA